VEKFLFLQGKNTPFNTPLILKKKLEIKDIKLIKIYLTREALDTLSKIL
jgi:hypothetical protein